MSATTLRPAAASFAYPGHPTDERARLAEALRSAPDAEGCFVLSTCLRTEIVTLGGVAALEDQMDRLFGACVDVRPPIVRTDGAAVEHLFRVAAGLESPIVGEQEILTQLRTALAEGERVGVVGGLLAKLIETAVSVGRRARQEMGGSPHDSLAAVACQLVGGADHVAVLGAGAMAAAVVDGLASLPAPPAVTVYVRSPEKVSFATASVEPFDRAVDGLTESPAVISATSAKRRVVDDEALARILQRRTAPFVLVDMAMPPDFRPPDGATVRYIDIDGLARLAGRRPRTSAVDHLVAEAADQTHRSLIEHGRVGPVIAGLMRSGDAVVDDVVARFERRLGGRDDGAVLRQAAHTVARTLLAAPVGFLRRTDRADETAGLLAEAFGIDDG